MDAPANVINAPANVITPVTPATPAKPPAAPVAVTPPPASKTSSKMDGVTIAILVIATVLGITLIAVIAVVGANYSKSKKVKRYYRGEGVRLASQKRRFNLAPASWSIGTFNRVLPGGAATTHNETFLLTNQDWRPFVARGDPVKVGPQVFMVSKDLSRAFTDSYVPLDTSTEWIDDQGRRFATPGKLLGPSQEGVTVYTCDSCELPNNLWKGPRGGAIGYWDRAGVWHEGSCTSECAHWYSPVWMGVACVQHDGPSPGTLAKVQTRELQKGGKGGKKGDSGGSSDVADEEVQEVQGGQQQHSRPVQHQPRPRPPPQHQPHHQARAHVVAPSPPPPPQQHWAPQPEHHAHPMQQHHAMQQHHGGAEDAGPMIAAVRPPPQQQQPSPPAQWRSAASSPSPGAAPVDGFTPL